MLGLRSVKVLVLAALAMVLVMTTNFSTAAFTSSSTTTATVRAAADWTPPKVQLTGTSTYLRGEKVALAAVASDGESRITDVTIEHAPKGAASWTRLCTSTTETASCTWDTTALRDGEYDVRSRATDAAGYSASTTSRVTLDNTVPTVGMKDPGTPLSGTRTFEAVGVGDATSGVARVDLEYALGTGAWRTLCTVPAPSTTWSCSYDTTSLAGGSYSFRATATDVAGNVATSGPVPGRLVDNTPATVSLKDPGAVLAGTATLAATASSAAGVTSVQFQYAAAGTGDWRVIATDATSPYSSGWVTTGVGNGLYDLRAVLLDKAGRTTHSTVLSARRVENAPPLAGLDVQAASGSVPGTISAGDSVTLTYTRLINHSTVLAGWNGSATQVTVRVRDGRVPGMGLTNKDTVLDVLTNGQPVEVGSVNLREGYLGNGATVLFTGTMTAGTTVVDGVERSTVTLVLGSPTSGASELKNVPQAQTMSWTPSSRVTDLLNRASSPVETHESGAVDVDL